jgi:hypothetical protein
MKRTNPRYNNTLDKFIISTNDLLTIFYLDTRLNMPYLMMGGVIC